MGTFDKQYFRDKMHQNHIIEKRLTILYKTESDDHESFTEFKHRMKIEKPELFVI